VWAFAPVPEEANVVHGEEFRAALLRPGDFGVFTGAHGKEEGGNRQLADGSIQGGGAHGDECPKDAWSECLLGSLGGVLVGVALQLSL
jgi:hypothetical protein